MDEEKDTMNRGIIFTLSALDMEGGGQKEKHLDMEEIKDVRSRKKKNRYKQCLNSNAF